MPADVGLTRLWTFQRPEVLEIIESTPRFVPEWNRTPENFRVAYRWMAARLSEAVGFATGAPPLWCWHSCVVHGRPPSVETATCSSAATRLSKA